MTKLRAHGERARYVFGPDENDMPGSGCHCTDCTAANRAFEANRQRQIAYGRWQPYVDAAPVRAHLRALAAAGIGRRRVASLTGLSGSVISRITYGGPGDRPPTARVRPATAAKILAVKPSLDSLGDKAVVDATGTRRRLQALVANGHSQARIGGRLGITPQNFTSTINGDRVTAATARAVVRLYDELWNVPPDESTHRRRIAASRARNVARAKGWPPPMAWDDDDIDDPAAGPAGVWQRTGSTRNAAEDVAEVLRWEGHADLAAARLGVAPGTVNTTMRRTRCAS